MASFKLSSILMFLSILLLCHSVKAEEIEQVALLSIKSALGDHPAFADWVKGNQTVCETGWSFIGCENGVVTELLFINKEFAAKNADWKKGSTPGALKGTFPWDSVLLLTNLKVINLEDNDLDGPVLPENIGSLQYLEELRLNKNNFSGEIPEGLTTLISLKALDLSDNQVSGDIPYDIYKLENLQVLNLANNKFGSFLPMSLGYVHSLEKLDLSNNQFQGGVPSLSPLYNLIFLKLGNNFFSGYLPENIYNATFLYYFDVSNNQLLGSFPKSLINRLNVAYIYLNDNSFSGNIPASIFSSPNLKALDISSNFFNGTLPNENSNGKGFKYDGNCLNDIPSQRDATICKSFYTPVVLFD